jgi:hypothetical protein
MFHIHAPEAIEHQTVNILCCDCNRVTPFSASFFEWYGWTVTCLTCGRQASDGQWMGGDGKRGRIHNIMRAMSMCQRPLA